MPGGRNYSLWAFGGYIALMVTVQAGNKTIGAMLTITIEGALLALAGITVWLTIRFRSRRPSTVHGRNDRG